MATPSGFAIACRRRAAFCVRAVLMRGRGLRRVGRGHPAMVEPDRVNSALPVRANRLPAPIAGGVGSGDRETTARRSCRRRSNAPSGAPSRLALFEVQITAICGTLPARAASVTRGGCSPLTRASPGVELTRIGALNVTPPSRLADAKMSVTPSAVEPDQTAATNGPSAASETLALALPATASVVGAGGAADCSEVSAPSANRPIRLPAHQAPAPRRATAIRPAAVEDVNCIGPLPQADVHGQLYRSTFAFCVRAFVRSGRSAPSGRRRSPRFETIPAEVRDS